MAEFAINDTWQELMQDTPFMLNYEQHPLKPMSFQSHSRTPAAVMYMQHYATVCRQSKGLP